MATYGLKTYKSDGTTVVLQNSSKSGVFGEAYTQPKTGVAGAITDIDFPQYTSRVLRVMQLKPGGHSWSISYNNGIPRIRFIEQGSVNVVIPDFYYQDTTVYIFVK